MFGRHSVDKETWRWNAKVQEVIKAEKEAKKMWEPADKQCGKAWA